MIYFVKISCGRILSSSCHVRCPIFGQELFSTLQNSVSIKNGQLPLVHVKTVASSMPHLITIFNIKDTLSAHENF